MLLHTYVPYNSHCPFVYYVCNSVHASDMNYLCSTFVHVGVYAPIFPIRLVNGSNSHTGRVEIYTNSTGGLDNARWGTVCDDAWDFLDARVVCRQLGYPDAVAALTSVHYGEGTVPILLSNVRCAGYEPSLTMCRHNGIRIFDCQHSKYAVVECLGMNYHII